MSERSRGYDGRMVAIERLWPTKSAWLIGSPYALRTPSPFLSLKEFAGWEDVASLLAEGEDVEIEFDTIGRELQIFGAWGGHKQIWFEALRAALTKRAAERQDSEQ